MAFTAAPSAPFLSPRPTQRAAAMAAASVTRISSRARLRSGTSLVLGVVIVLPPAQSLGLQADTRLLYPEVFWSHSAAPRHPSDGNERN
ncbi:unannotated protein [freshwater metagenome]|uniref:Unannotated protein n=1 Tax=freshwater metagenome TaxID=449393 RepID=A0A6J7HC06_9ZZZZ